jgi:hypothetical protein
MENMDDGNPCSCISMFGDRTSGFLYLLPSDEEKG